MKKILFRGKRADNGEWVFGDLIQVGNKCFIVNGCELEVVENGFDFRPLRYFEVIPKTVGQFTGLCDKNGANIFEGDIVNWTNIDDFEERHTTSDYFIIFDDKYLFGYIARKKFINNKIQTNLDFSLIEIFKKEIEVIGNIYDNPELLEDEDNL